MQSVIIPVQINQAITISLQGEKDGFSSSLTTVPVAGGTPGQRTTAITPGADPVIATNPLVIAAICISSPGDQPFKKPLTVEIPPFTPLRAGQSGFPVFRWIFDRWGDYLMSTASIVDGIGANAGRRVLRLTVERGGTYVVLVTVTDDDASFDWSVGTPEPFDSPMTATGLPGKSNIFVIPNAYALTITPRIPDGADFLVSSFLLLPPGNGPGPLNGALMVRVPAGVTVMVRKHRYIGSVTLIKSVPYTFTRIFPVVTVVKTPPPDSVVLQGHSRGGGRPF